MLRELKELWWWPPAFIAFAVLVLWGDGYGDPTVNWVAIGLFALIGLARFALGLWYSRPSAAPSVDRRA